MDDKAGFAQLIRQAQLGDQRSMGELAEVVRGRVFVYIYRLTLDHDLAEDLLQETLLKMVESLKDLERPERFWFWLFRTAMGQVQHYFRNQRQRQMVRMSALSKERLSQCLSKDHDDGLDTLARKELSDVTLRAMAKLKLAYRNVLVLRCFENMSYAEIAELMDCKELRARVLFFRAKHSLRRQLSRGGFSKALLVTALGLFGLITAPAKGASAASTVTSASLEVGVAATIVGAAGSRLGVAMATGVAALTLSLTYEKFIYLFLLLCFILVCFVVALYSE